jgi:hypothetical protein|tara:strand:+ start:3593 stop:4087 length:495 start_codon:yes stop_codon:yes gene_type:complete
MKKKNQFSRRKLLIMASSAMAVNPLIAVAGQNNTNIHVVKNPQCGCCNAWIKILTDQDFNVTTENSSGSLLTEFKIESGIPKDMMSCHTAKVGGYFIEGHVPVSDIRRVIAERPDALGLAVPAMPYGSPGMGPEEERDAYDVFIVRTDGSTEVFQHYPQGGIQV